MSVIKLRLVDPVADRTQVPVGWIAYRSTKTVFEMLREQVDQIMATEGSSREEAEEELLRRAMASLEATQAG